MRARYFLLGLLLGGLLGAGLTSCLSGMRRMFTMTEAEARLLAMESGNLIVAALYAYRDREGDWPENLEALVPKYLPTRPEFRWWLMRDEDRATLTGKTGWEADMIEFDLGARERGWWRCGESLEVRGPPTSQPTTD
jgi:hypothetical protein